MDEEAGDYQFRYKEARQEALGLISSRIRVLAAGDELAVLDAGVERHGSWEWVALSEERDLARYVIVNIIDTPIANRTSSRARCHVELWGGLDDRDRFGRRLFAKRASTWMIAEGFIAEQWAGLIAFVSRLDESALQETYWAPESRSE